MPNAYYQVIPKCEGPERESLALSVDPRDPHGRVIVQRRAFTDPPDAQLWTPLVYPAGGSAPFGFLLVNKATGRVASMGDGDDSGLVQLPLDAVDPVRSVWEAVTPAAGLVLRIKSRPAQNLNVFMGTPWPWQVGTYAWGDGQPNELWRLALVLTDLVSVPVAGQAPQPTRRVVER